MIISTFVRFKMIVLFLKTEISPPHTEMNCPTFRGQFKDISAGPEGHCVFMLFI